MVETETSREALERAYKVIKRPLLTEKSNEDQEGKVPVPATNRGAPQRHAYHFEVPRWANKVEIRRAVEILFSVKVESVNTITKRGKPYRRGWVAGHGNTWKKAVVTLQPGEAIEFV